MFRNLLARARRGAHSAAVLTGLGALMAVAVVPLSGFAAAPSSLCAVTDTQCVITFGNTRIAERQAALAKLNSRVTAVFTAGHISSADNSALTSDISANESGLTTLKGQLDSATDAKTARTDVKLIYTQYRIYAVVLPRDYHELWLDVVTHVDARLKNAEPLIRDAINGAPSGVQAQANTLFADYQSQVATAEAQTQAAEAILPQLTPTSFNTSATAYQAQFGSFKTDIQTAHTATKQAISDLHQIIVLLKGANAATATPAV
jgi:hypothetical protein